MLDDDYDDGDESLKTVWLRVWPLVLFKNEEYLRSQDRPLYLVPNIRFFRPRRMGNSRCFRVYLETEIFQDRVDWLLFQKSKTRRNWRNSDEQQQRPQGGLQITVPAANQWPSPKPSPRFGPRRKSNPRSGPVWVRPYSAGRTAGPERDARGMFIRERGSRYQCHTATSACTALAMEH